MLVLPGWDDTMVARSGCLHDLHCGYLLGVDGLDDMLNMHWLNCVGRIKLRRHSLRLRGGHLHGWV